MTKISTGRRISFHIIMVCFVLTSTLLLAEITLRLSGRVTIQSVRGAEAESFDFIPGAFEPGQHVIERPRRELTHEVSINSLGFRGPEVNRRKNPGTIRILCLGDSFTYGSYVNDSETFSHYLQERFRQRRLPVEIINGGVGGTTIVDQLYYLKKSIEIAPDIVILTFSENDIDDLRKTQPMYVSLAVNRRFKSAPIVRTLYRLIRNTAVFNFALLLKAKYARSPDEKAEQEKQSSPNQASQEIDQEILWKEYETNLKAMRDFLRKYSIHFTFVIFPSDHRFGRRLITQGTELNRIEELAKGSGVPTLNLLSTLQQTGLRSQDLYLLPYDGHPSKVAYAIAADAIFEYLLRTMPEGYWIERESYARYK